MKAKAEKKKLITLYIDESQLNRLKALSKKTRVPRSEYIREGIEYSLNKYERKIKKG